MIKYHLKSLILAAGFLLGIHNGYIALWRDGNPEPQVSAYRADLLPPEDQRRLKEGIRIDDEAQLIQLLEDYLS